ncbi:hypothetical protein COO60DRAFT_628905 [Scenedesmus sp. NREL 46B-D3]|nr:hypothetical protein COO60DRAFT_628905 [Scenedesmus sp. NREL 46B-D3]
MALRLQQALVDSPLTNLKSESVRSFIGVLAQRFGLHAVLDGDLQQQFHRLLSAIFEANLGWFICDYIAIVCNDKDYSSADPEEWQLLQPTAVLGWSQATANELLARVLSLFQSGASPDTIIELAHATKTLLSVAGHCRPLSSQTAPAARRSCIAHFSCCITPHKSLWLASAVPFAHGFQLPLTLVQQWQCHYLMDRAVQQQQEQQGGSSSSSEALDEACSLLGAVACPATPFRFVEALLAAGRPATALAVQRARCATSSSSSSRSAASLQLSLREAVVLLWVQLRCGLLAEAFSELRRHCSQLLPNKRSLHVKALVQQLATWATDEQQLDQPDSGSSSATQQQQQQQEHVSRVQQLMQLPLDCDEEAALLGWFRQRMQAGQPGGHVLPLYLLQRGRSLEALAAYAEYKASPAAQAATSASASLLQRQLHTLMSAAAAALPPALRATATSAAAAAAGGARPTVAGLVAGAGTAADGDVSRSAAVSDVPSVSLMHRGVEAPVFMSPLIAAQPEVQGSLAAAAAAAAAVAVDTDMDAGMEGTPAAAAAAGGSAATNALLQGSLFGGEVLAEAGPGSVALNNPSAKPQGLAGHGRLQHDGTDGAGSEFVPLLFGTPAPAAAAALGAGSGMAAAAAAGAGGSLFGGLDAGVFAGATTPAGLAPGLFAMSEADFGRDVLGIGGKGAAAAAAAAAGGVAAAGGGGAGGGSGPGRRSSKRQKQAPVRY